MVVSRSRVSRWKLSLLILLRIFILLLSSFIFFLPSFLLFLDLPFHSIATTKQFQFSAFPLLAPALLCSFILVHPLVWSTILFSLCIDLETTGPRSILFSSFFSSLCLYLPLSSPFCFFLVLLRCESQIRPAEPWAQRQWESKGERVAT